MKKQIAVIMKNETLCLVPNPKCIHKRKYSAGCMIRSDHLPIKAFELRSDKNLTKSGSSPSYRHLRSENLNPSTAQTEIEGPWPKSDDCKLVGLAFFFFFFCWEIIWASGVRLAH